jgi:uncharacterized protein YbjQ (UPF0145 family)
MNISGLSGNEVYCLQQKGWAPGGIVVGNSVQSLGFAGGIDRVFKTMAGGEIENLTQLISEGRHAALKRIEREAQERGAGGLTGVTLEVKTLGGMIEFLAVGSAIHRAGEEGRGPDRTGITRGEGRGGEQPSGSFFSTACSGQDLYCHIDAGYEPRHLVLGNVAYAMGIGRGISGAFRQFSARGEVKEFSDMYNHTRHLALGRLEDEAEQRGCNAVVDIITRVIPMSGALEILMVGTGSHNPVLSKGEVPATSELTGEELWNLTQMGYEPVRLVLGTSVYSLGLAGGIKALFRSMSRGEVPEVTHLVHEARENCLDHLDADARAYRADAVIGTKLFISELGSSLIEVLAIGTRRAQERRHEDAQRAAPAAGHHPRPRHLLRPEPVEPDARSHVGSAAAGGGADLAAGLPDRAGDRRPGLRHPLLHVHPGGAVLALTGQARHAQGNDRP